MRGNESDDQPVVWSVTRRSWLAGVWGNPLARGADRWQAGVRILLIVLWALMLPVAGTWAFVTVADGLHETELQSHDRTAVTAALTADAPPLTYTAGGVPVLNTAPVAARWLVPDGTIHTGTIAAQPGLRAGAPVAIWVDRSGQQVDAPLTATEAVSAGILLAVGMTLLWGLLMWGLYLWNGTCMDRGRRRAWERDWERVAPLWLRQQY